jgi:hypothetical protein
MKLWKILAVASVAMAFSVSAKAQCGPIPDAMKSAIGAFEMFRQAARFPTSRTSKSEV